MAPLRCYIQDNGKMHHAQLLMTLCISCGQRLSVMANTAAIVSLPLPATLSLEAAAVDRQLQWLLYEFFCFHLVAAVGVIHTLR